MRGESYLKTGQPEKDGAQYLQVLANPGIDPLSPMLPLAHLGLARAYNMEGKFSQSRSEYEQFFSSWKSADATLPVLLAAREEYRHVA